MRLLFSLIKIIFILFVTFVLYMVIRSYLFFRGTFSGKTFSGGGARPNKSEPGSVQTVKCANCDTYVADELKVSGRFNGNTLDFCSEECKNAYKNK